MMKDKPPPQVWQSSTKSRTNGTKSRRGCQTSPAPPPLRRAATSLSRDRYFQVYCLVEVTGEKFLMKNVSGDMKVRELKDEAEFATGIPQNLQRLCYLDEGDLLDHTDLRHNDIIPGAVINMKIWNTWQNVVKAAATNDVDMVFQNGVTSHSDFRSPNSDYLSSINPRLREQWLADRAFVSLYIAAHRGHKALCDKLIQSGVNVNAATPLGRSALHVAAARGHGKIVDTLLESGADIDAQDKTGQTPLSISERFGNKTCERHLFLFRWQQRAKQTLQNKMSVEMFAHQYFDSANPVWLKGALGQVYFTQILPRGEYGGTGLGAPKHEGGGERRPASTGGSTRELHDSTTSNGMPAIPEDLSSFTGDRKNQNGGTSKPKAAFEEWLRGKKQSEQAKIDQKRAEEQKKRMARDMKQREKDIKEKSYDNWLLKQRQTATNERSPPPTTPHHNRPITNKTMTDILRGIANRRNQDHVTSGGNSGIVTGKIYEDLKGRGKKQSNQNTLA